MKECCANPDNLEDRPQERADLVVKVCRVCGRRHIKLKVEPGKLGATFNRLGRP